MILMFIQIFGELFVSTRKFLCNVKVLRSLPLLTIILVANAQWAFAQESQIDKDLIDASISDLESYYKAGKYTALEVTRWHLGRIAKYESRYNAFIKVFSEEAEARAARLDAEDGAPKGPLWGVPVVVKGSISIKGETTNVGWWGYTISGLELRARANATVVDKLLNAGAVILGQTNLPDLAASDTTKSSVAGRTGNAYAVEFSPGGSSGGSATAVAASFAVIGLGTDGGNSIRNPSANSSLVGVLPTKGLISIAGVHAGDFLKERTGALTRTVADAAAVLDVLAGLDKKDPNTIESKGKVHKPYSSYLQVGALKGKRFGVPKFIIDGTPTLKPNPKYWNYGTSPATRAQFMRIVGELREAGATVIFADDILPESFKPLAASINTSRYHRQGVDSFLRHYGPKAYSSTDEFESIVGINYPARGMGGPDSHHILEKDPDAEKEYFGPLREALRIYRETMRRYNLDGYVYPPLQIPPPNECWPLPRDFPSDGPYSATSWANRLGIPAVVVPGGYYGTGLPVGLEISGDKWSEGKLLSYAYDYETKTHHRKPPILRLESPNKCFDVGVQPSSVKD